MVGYRRSLFQNCLLLTIVALMATGCKRTDYSGFFSPTSKDVEARFAQSEAWNAAHDRPFVTLSSGNYRVYCGSDVHTDTSTIHLKQLLAVAAADNSSAFMLLLGDLVDIKGAFHLFAPTIAAQYKETPHVDTIFTTVGNHDLFFDQWEDYAAYFGTSHYSIEVRTPDGNDLFVILDSGGGTLGKSQRRWLQNLLENERDNYRHCIVGSHTNMFKTDNSQFPTSSMALEETYFLADLFSRHRVAYYINGHDHTHGVDRFNNVTYITIGRMRDTETNPVYLTLDVGNTISFASRTL